MLTGLGAEQELPLGERSRIGVKADDLQKVALIAAANQRLQGEGDFFGLAVFAEAGHAPRHVERTTVAHDVWYSVS